MRIAAFSDTHGHHKEVLIPPADVLVFAGDFMTTGYSWRELTEFSSWFCSQPHKHKVWIAGNHDRLVEALEGHAVGYFRRATYLHDSTTVIDGRPFYGSPYTPWFNDWAFNVQPDHIKRVWDRIPMETSVLITHGPPLGQMDSFYDHGLKKIVHAGDPELHAAVRRVKPRIHIFGHIHAGYGEDIVGPTRSYNVAICNEAYVPTNDVTVIDI